MFTEKDLSLIDRDYFRIYEASETVVVLQSLNTKHCWHIYSPNNEFLSDYHIFHKHEGQIQYHRHGYRHTFSDVLADIRNHDRYQIKVRWRKRR